MDTKIPWQSTRSTEGEARTTKNLRNHYEMETLGNHRVKHTRRPYTHGHTLNPTRLSLIRYADYQREKLCLDEEKD